MHVFRLCFCIVASHSLEIQRRLAETRKVAGRELWIDGLGGSVAVRARLGGGWDGDGVVAEMRRHSIPDCFIEAVIVAKIHVIAAEAPIVLARN